MIWPVGVFIARPSTRSVSPAFSSGAPFAIASGRIRTTVPPSRSRPVVSPRGDTR